MPNVPHSRDFPSVYRNHVNRGWNRISLPSYPTSLFVPLAHIRTRTHHTHSLFPPLEMALPRPATGPLFPSGATNSSTSGPIVAGDSLMDLSTSSLLPPALGSSGVGGAPSSAATTEKDMVPDDAPRLKLNASLNAIASSPDGDQVVVAGREGIHLVMVATVVVVVVGVSY